MQNNHKPDKREEPGLRTRFTDVLAMVIAALYIMLPIILILIAAAFVVFGLFVLVFR